MSDKTDMGSKLAESVKKVEVQRAERRERIVKGSHLLNTFTSLATSAGCNVEEKSGFMKISGPTKGRLVYVAKKGGRVDLSGFTVEAAAVSQISEETARQKHLGKVRGQLDFDQADDAVIAAYNAALVALRG